MSNIDEESFYSNTSLRRTCKTRQVMQGIPSAVTKRRMGHISQADQEYVDEQQFDKLAFQAVSSEPKQLCTSSFKGIPVNICNTNYSEFKFF